MAHYAFLDENNVVVQVIPGRDEDEVVDGISDWEKYYGDLMGMKCVRTSYHGNIRKRFAAIGGTYNEEADVFIARQPHPSWTLNENFDWQPPVPLPEAATLGLAEYYWDEENKDWALISYQYEPFQSGPVETNYGNP